MAEEDASGSDSGSPSHSKSSLMALKKDKLAEVAKEEGVEVTRAMTKAELAAAVLKKQ